MSADLLRRAAALLRERAKDAQCQEPWCPDYAHAAVRHVQRNCDLEVNCSAHEDPQECGQFGMYDGRYVALMHPPVALAMADLLEAHAPLFSGLHGPIEHEVFVLARAILREEAS